MTAAPAPSITAAQLPALAERYNLPLEAMQVLLEVASLYSGGAIKGDPTHLCVTGHHVWLARIGLEKLADQAALDAQSVRDGIYAIHYLDNWDGEGDTCHLIARKAKGAWFAEESGKPLFQYEGDSILRVWPLDCDPIAPRPDQHGLIEALKQFSTVADQMGSETAPTLMQSIALLAINERAKAALADLSAQGDAQ